MSACISYTKWCSFIVLNIVPELIIIKPINQKRIKSFGFISHSKVSIELDPGIKSLGNFAIRTVNAIDYKSFMFHMTEEDVIELISNFQ